MYKIIDERGTGKTVRLITLAKEQGAILVCKDPKGMVAKMYALGITGVEVLSYDDFISTQPTHYNRKFLIDELDYFVKNLISKGNYGELLGYTLTQGE